LLINLQVIDIIFLHQFIAKYEFQKLLRQTNHALTTYSNTSFYITSIQKTI